MKIHFIGESAGGGTEALASWEHEKLIPYLTKSCTGFMMPIGNEKFLTDDMDKVTCKLCIRRWNKYVREKG